MPVMKLFQAVPLSTSEDELIRQAQAADLEAFCLLAQRYERRIYSLALHYCHNHQDAEDLSQEVWLKCYQALHAFKGESSFYTWLRKITINCFLNHQRARSFRWRGQTTIVQLLDVDSLAAGENREPAADSEKALLNRMMVQRVMQALSELTSQQRLIFLLKHHEEMTYEEIAQAVGCSTGTAKKSVSRAVIKLREHLNIDVQSRTTLRALPGNLEIGVQE
jgi:RNA polymerase sigma-70 factor, ECF subfamily